MLKRLLPLLFLLTVPAFGQDNYTGTLFGEVRSSNGDGFSSPQYGLGFEATFREVFGVEWFGLLADASVLCAEKSFTSNRGGEGCPASWRYRAHALGMLGSGDIRAMVGMVFAGYETGEWIAPNGTVQPGWKKHNSSMSVGACYVTADRIGPLTLCAGWDEPVSEQGAELSGGWIADLRGHFTRHVRWGFQYRAIQFNQQGQEQSGNDFALRLGWSL